MNISPTRGNRRKKKPMNAITKATSVAVLVALGLALAMTEDRYKFRSSLDLPRPKEEVLFDLDADPKETKNLAGEQPDVAKRMRAALVAWHRSAVASQQGKDYR